MDFASEPVRDAFPPPPTRQAQAAAASRDDSGRSFDDHLEVATATPQDDVRDAPAAPAEVRADDAEAPEEDIDADSALLGGPLPPAPPQIAAAVAVQIAASQAGQMSDAAPSDDAQLAALSAPQPAAPAPSPSGEAETGAAAQPAAPSPDLGEAAPNKTPSADTQQAPQQAQAAPLETPAPQTAAQQMAGAPTATSDLPQAVQQAIAAPANPAPQAVTQPTTRATKDAAHAVEAKSAPEGQERKTAPISNAKAQAANAKAGDRGRIEVDAAPAAPLQSLPSGASQSAESSALSATTTQASTHVQQNATETGAQRAAPAAAQVGREIIRRFNGGATNFELRLDPADLGRVEVRMEVTRDHRVTAVITADNPQALTELARGARDLEQQLQSAGLQLSENGLSFDLRQGAQGRGDSEDARANVRSTGEITPAEQQAAPVARPIGYERWRGVRVDMMV